MSQRSQREAGCTEWQGQAKEKAEQNPTGVTLCRQKRDEKKKKDEKERREKKERPKKEETEKKRDEKKRRECADV